MNAELIILVLIFVLSFILLIRNFNAGIIILLILSVLLHKELFSILRWDLLPVRIFMLALLAYSVWRFIYWLIKERNKEVFLKSLFDPFVLSLLALWIIRGISILNSESFTSSIFLFGFFTTVTALGLYLYKYLEHKPHQVINIFKAYVGIVLALSLVGILQFILYLRSGVIFGAIWNVPGHLPRIGSLFWDVNHFGGLLAGVLPLLGGLILTAQSFKNKAVYALVFLPIGAVLLMTNSRTAWLSAFVSFVVFATLILVRKVGMGGVGIVLGILILIAIPLVREYNIKASPFRARVKQYFHYRIDSFDSHFMLLEGALQVFEKYSFLGGGYGSFFEHFSKTRVAAEFFGRDPAALNVRVPAHTIWGELLAETGIIGLAAFIVFISVGLVPLLYISLNRREGKDYLLAATMFSAIAGWLTGGIFYSYNTEFFWIILFLYFIFGIHLLGKDGVTKAFSHYFQKSLPLFLIIFLLSVFLVGINLGKNHLLPWDEAIYAQISKNMVETGDFIVQRWWPDRVWYEKPPLSMWLMAASFKVFGISSLAARIPSALLGIGTIILTYYFGKKLFSKTAGFLAAFVLLTTFNFLYYSRASMLDVSATFFITLALFAYWIYKEKLSYPALIVSALATGLSVMVKGVIGFIPLPIIFLYEIYLYATKQQKISLKNIRDYFFYFLISAVVFVPWHLTMYLKFGNAFLQNYIGYHVLDRAITAIEDKGRPFWWYIVVMKVSMRIWFVALIPALGYFLYKVYKKSNKHVFISIWGLFIFLLFSAATSKLKWYIIPVYPAAALMVGYIVEQMVGWFLSLLNKRLRVFNLILAKMLAIFLIITAGLFYLFLNRGLVYETDLTGAQATLLEQKDQIFGAEHHLYVDRIELPLVLFYSDSPFEVVDFGPLEERIRDTKPDDYTLFITKESRFRKLRETYPTLTLVSEQKEWILGFYSNYYAFDGYEKNIVLISDLTNK